MKFGSKDPNMVMIQCGTCGDSWWTLDPGMACNKCSKNRMLAQLAPEVLQEVEDLLRNNRKVEAVHLLKQRLPVGLREALELADHLVMKNE